MAREIRLQYVRWDITNRCNLNCRHCQDASFRSSENVGHVSLQNAQKIISELKRVGVDRVGLLGGEPTVNPDLTKIVAALNGSGVSVDITSNGTVLSEDLIKGLTNQQDCNFSISLEGGTADMNDRVRGKGSFQKALRALRTLVRLRDNERIPMEVQISHAITKPSSDSIESLLSIAKDEGVDACIVTTVHQVGNAARWWDDLAVPPELALKSARRIARWLGDNPTPIRWRLNFLQNVVVHYLRQEESIFIFPYKRFVSTDAYSEAYIQANGRLFPSQAISEMFPQALVGPFADLNNSLYNTSFEQIWFSEAFETFRRDFLARDYIRHYSSCGRCPFADTLCWPTSVAWMSGVTDPYPLCSYVLDRLSL